VTKISLQRSPQPVVSHLPHRSSHAFSDERPAEQKAECQSPSRSSPNEQELKHLKQRPDRHDRRIKRHDEISGERERQDRQCALVLYGLKGLDVQSPRNWKIMDDPVTQQLLDAMPINDIESEWSSSNNRKPRPVLIGIPSIEESKRFCSCLNNCMKAVLGLMTC